MNAEPCTQYEERIYAVLLGDAEEAVRADVDTHRAGCPACDAAYRETEAALRLVATHTPALPDEAYWETFTDRLEQRLAAETSPIPPVDRAPIRRRQRVGLVRLAAAVVLLLGGIWIGRITVDQKAAVVPEEGGGLLPASLNTQTMRYLDRANVLLLGLVNFDPSEDDPAGINLPARQEMARNLLEETAALSEALSPSERLMLRALMADLERVLLQIANLEQQVDLPSIELVQRGVDQNALLLKINLARMRMVEEQAVQPAPADAL